MKRDKTKSAQSALKYAKVERAFVKTVSMKGYRKALARAERKAAKHMIRSMEWAND